MRISLRQLEVFDAICRLGGVTVAADAIGLSQSAASQALAELESALDGALFDRIGRRLQLNDRGRQLRAQAAELLDRAAAIESGLRGRSTPEHVRLQLAASLTVGGYLLPPLLGAQLKQHPEIRVYLEVLNTRLVVDAVVAFRVDAGFVEGSVSHPDLTVHHWSEDRLAVIAARDDPLAQGRVDIRGLAAARWIVREPGSGTHEVFVRAAQAAGFTPTIALELGHPEAVVRATAAGAGLGCVPRVVAEPAVARRELVILHTPFLDLRRPLSLVLHRNKFVGGALRMVLDALAPGAL